MMERGIRESSFNFSYPFIGKDFAAGGAETTFAGMRDNNILIRMIRADKFMVTGFVGVSTGKHFFYNSRDIVRDRVFMLIKIIRPVFLKDLFYGVSF